MAHGFQTELQILSDCQSREDVPVLRNVAESQLGYLKAFLTGNLFALEADRAVWLYFSHDRLDRG